MTGPDDDDLIEGLRSGLAEREAQISAPVGIADDARHAARRRSASRMIGVGVWVLVAAVVATVLATGSGSGGATGAVTPSVNPGVVSPGYAESTAYIVRRVTARIADAGHRGVVVRTRLYAGTSASTNGSFRLGPLIGRGWDYDAPDGTLYQRNVGIDVYGRPTGITGFAITTPGSAIDRISGFTLTTIDSARHTFSRQHSVYSAPAGSAATPPIVDLQSSPTKVQQALERGRVTEQAATATISGRRAIALVVRLPYRDHLHYIVYVDAQTDQPLRTVTTGTGPSNAATFVADWVPATPDHIAAAKDDSIPPGYTQVGQPAG
jgi:hypothetical protein